MSTFARIIDDIAVDVCRVPPDQAFCEALALQFVAVPDEVVPGSRFTAAAASDTALFARAEQIKAAMEADPVNFSLSEFSWPSIYGE